MAGRFGVGVSWHSRYNKFTARMTVAGKARHLGYFATADGAAAAYAAARSDTPPLKSSGTKGKFKQGSNATALRGAWAAAEVRPLAAGFVLAMPDDGQAYALERVEVYASARSGGECVRYHWSAACRLCGEPFTAVTAGGASGLVRTCPEHRGRGGKVPAALLREAKALGCSVETLREAMQWV
jgi:hypothetical protein